MGNTTKNDGGPAFPSEDALAAQMAGCCPTVERGMSLRDWFAGMAMQGLLSNNLAVIAIGEINNQDPKRTADHLARRPFQLSNAMLCERSRE